MVGVVSGQLQGNSAPTLRRCTRNLHRLPRHRGRFTLVTRCGPLVLLTHSQQALSPEPRERFDEVAHLGDPQPLVGDLLVQAQLPSKVASFGLLVQGFDLSRVRPHVVMIPGQAGLDQAVCLSAKGTGHLVEADLGMVLYAPEHAAVETDLGGLHSGQAVAGEQHGARRQRLNLVRVDGRGVVRGGTASQERMRAARLGRRYPPRKGGLLPACVGRTLPPGETAATCKPAHEPKDGAPEANTDRMNATVRRVSGVSSYRCSGEPVRNTAS